MSRAEQIKSLIRSHAKDDDTLFYAAALQIAATAERAGQVYVARDLRRLVDESKAIRSKRPTSSPAQVSGKLAGLLSVEHPKTRLNDMALDAAVAGSLTRIIHASSSPAKILAPDTNSPEI